MFTMMVKTVNGYGKGKLEVVVLARRSLDTLHCRHAPVIWPSRSDFSVDDVKFSISYCNMLVSVFSQHLQILYPSEPWDLYIFHV